MATKKNTPYNSADFDFGDLRLCVSCRKMLPREVFNTNAKGVTSTRCALCRDQEKDVRKRAKQVEESDRKLGIVLGESGKFNAPHISEVAADVMRQLGGIEMFSVLLKHHLYAAMANDAADPHVFKVLKGIAELVYQSTQAGDTAPDLGGESTEDIERTLVGLMREAGDLEPDMEEIA